MVRQGRLTRPAYLYEATLHQDTRLDVDRQVEVSSDTHDSPCKRFRMVRLSLFC